MVKVHIRACCVLPRQCITKQPQAELAFPFNPLLTHLRHGGGLLGKTTTQNKEKESNYICCVPRKLNHNF